MSRVNDIEVAKKLIALERSATDRKIEFKVSFKKLKQLLERDTCFYTGVKFEEESGKPNSRSIDRMDNEVGYIDSNIVACTRAINGKKDNLTIEELKAIYTKLKQSGKI